MNNQTTPKVTAADVNKKFTNALKNAINELNTAQLQSDITTEKFVKGEITDLHDVMIASQKASITMQATIEVRNKVIDAYREIMRMQV
ncbi:MAG TPA: flagellar hook-basal body complex protein FliE [Bacillus bacterium]|nr:flagellar hook-basal body complex protein FliE [Bacillus sp. (in: firmicutes)]